MRGVNITAGFSHFARPLAVSLAAGFSGSGSAAPDPMSGELIIASGQGAPGVNGTLIGSFCCNPFFTSPVTPSVSFDNDGDFVFVAALVPGDAVIQPIANLALYHWDADAGTRLVARNGCDPCGFCQGGPAADPTTVLALPGDAIRYALRTNSRKGPGSNQALAAWRDGTVEPTLCEFGTTKAPPVDTPGGVIMETEDLYVEYIDVTAPNGTQFQVLSFVTGDERYDVLRSNTRPPGVGIKLAQSDQGFGDPIWADVSTGADGSGVVTTELFQNANNGVTDINKWLVFTLDGTDAQPRLRGGEEVAGLPGFVYRGEGADVEMISSGRFLIDAPLAPVGDPGGVFDAILEIAGDAAAILQREGDPAPLIAGATLGSVDLRSRNRFGDYTFSATLAPGPSVTADNDEVLYLVRSGTPMLLLREGDSPAGLSSSVVEIPDDVTNPNVYGDLPIEVDGRWLAYDGVQGVFSMLFDAPGTSMPIGPGGTPVTLSSADVTRVNDQRNAVTEYRYVDAMGDIGEQLRAFSFAGPAPCSTADLAPLFGQLDLSDIDTFITAFLASEPAADLVEPLGVIDLADTDAFIAAFLAGCP